jgi:hypothetical protein
MRYSVPTGLPCRIAMPRWPWLQFMVTGKDQSEVPASVHCDHLITGKLGAERISALPWGPGRFTIFSVLYPQSTTSDFGNRSRDNSPGCA